MSQEFEKIVLEKLDKMDAKLDEHTNILNEHTKTLNGHFKQIQHNTREIEGLTEVLIAHNGAIESINKKIDGLVDSVKVHQNLFTTLEYDLNLKFNALMDFFKMNEKNHEEYEEIIAQYNSKLLNHEIRICDLENLVDQNLKTA